MEADLQIFNPYTSKLILCFTIITFLLYAEWLIEKKKTLSTAYFTNKVYVTNNGCLFCTDQKNNFDLLTAIHLQHFGTLGTIGFSVVGKTNFEVIASLFASMSLCFIVCGCGLLNGMFYLSAMGSKSWLTLPSSILTLTDTCLPLVTALLRSLCSFYISVISLTFI